MGLFGAKKSTGLSITDERIRFAVFEEGETQPRLCDFGFAKLPAGTIEHGKIIDHDQLVETLRALRRDHGIKRVHVGVSDRLAYSWTTTHKKNGEDWNESLQRAIRQHIDDIGRDDLKHSTIEYEIIDETADALRAFVWVLPNRVIDTYTEIARLAGVRALSVQTNMYHVASRCAQGSTPGTCMFVDVGTDRSHIAVVDDGRVASMATVPIGGASIQPMIDQYLKLHPEKAVEFESSIGMSPMVNDQTFLEKISRAIAPLAERVTSERIHWDEQKPRQIDHVRIMGEHAHQPGLHVYLSRLTDTPAKHLDIWGNEYLRTHIPDLSFDESLKYASAIALAMQGFEV